MRENHISHLIFELVIIYLCPCSENFLGFHFFAVHLKNSTIFLKLTLSSYSISTKPYPFQTKLGTCTPTKISLATYGWVTFGEYHGNDSKKSNQFFSLDLRYDTCGAYGFFIPLIRSALVASLVCIHCDVTF